MQIFEEHKQRLDLTFPEDQPFDRIQCPLTALWRVQGVPRFVIDGDIQQRQERRQQRLERAVQHQELAGHSFADLALVVAVMDPEIRLQQLDDRQVRRGLPVGNRAAFEYQPAVGAV